MIWREALHTALAAGVLAIGVSAIPAAPAQAAWGGGYHGAHWGGGWSGGLHAGFGFRGGWGGWHGGYGYGRPGWGYGAGWRGYPGYRVGFGYGYGGYGYRGGYGYPAYNAPPVVTLAAPVYVRPYAAPIYHHRYYHHVATICR